MFKRFKKTYTKCYMLKEDNVSGYQIVKVLNEYETEEEAKDDLVKLLANQLTEEDLLEMLTEVSRY